MGARGPAPLPDNVRQLRGNPGGRPAPSRLKLPPRAPTPPTWFDAEAKAEWKRVVPQLDRMGVLATVDRAILSAYCETWSVYVKARRELRKKGLIVDDRKNPLWQIFRESGTQLRELAKELYLTPTARLRSDISEGAPSGSTGPADDEEDVLD